jgi:hypothetical protein
MYRKECVDLEDQAADGRPTVKQDHGDWTGVTEFNPAIIWSAITLPSLSFDTLDPSESGGGKFV